MLRVATLNINGVRASHRRGFGDWLATRACDVVALQEVRAPIGALPPGAFGDYHVVYEPGQVPGRNGVAVLTRERPVAVRTWDAEVLVRAPDEEHLHTEPAQDEVPLARGLGRHAHEGRYVEVDLAEAPVTVASLYLPKGGLPAHLQVPARMREEPDGGARHERKMRFMSAFARQLSRTRRAAAARGRDFLLMGDLNVAHTSLDVANWRRRQTSEGFLPEERAWIDAQLSPRTLVDVVRSLNPGVGAPTPGGAGWAGRSSATPAGGSTTTWRPRAWPGRPRPPWSTETIGVCGCPTTPRSSSTTTSDPGTGPWLTVLRRRVYRRWRTREGERVDDPVLAADGLVKRFGALTAVDDVSFDIAAGETFGLLGPNGAGKTTTISMIAGLLVPDAGTVTVAGVPMGRSPVEAKRHIGLVPQDLAIYPDLSARANLEYFGQLQGLRGSALKGRIAQVLELIGLADRAKEPSKKFSGGMKRRLNIGVGLLHRPTLLILDEPTVGVDPQSRNSILESIEALSLEGMAVLYTTHYMEEAERLCDRIAIVDDGRIQAEGTRDELIELTGGVDTIRLTGSGELDAGAAAVEGVPAVRRVVRDRGTLVLTVHSAPTAIAPIVNAATGAGLSLSDVEISRPDLESVFLHLTGKALRD